MDKVIGGKRYDTDKAKRVGAYDNGLYPGDLGFYSETLYLKRTGEFFLHCEGGPQTRLAKRDGTSLTAGEEIVPLPYEDAEKWAEGHLDTDGYAALFGEPDEGEAVINAVVSAAIKSRLDREAAKRGVLQRQVLEELIGTL